MPYPTFSFAQPKGRRASLAIILALAAQFGSAQINAQSDGSDGAPLTGGNPIVLDLSQAPTGVWNSPAPIPGKGIYDPNLWAVVYKFSNINLYNTVSFLPHPSGCPVVFLVSGDVTLGSNVYINAGGQGGTAQGIPGPGGFRGGAGLYLAPGSAGFGPGGGGYVSGGYGSSAGHASAGFGPLGGAPYGNPKCIPLVGGSGGAGRADGPYAEGGGPGGGAILIACNGTMTLSGIIYAQGASTGTGGGSGGTIRLVANQVNLSGSLSAIGGFAVYGGAPGRIRIEANSVNITGQVNPLPSIATAAATPQLWPDSTTPLLKIIGVGGTVSPADPRSNLYVPDIELTSSGNKVIQVTAQDVPTDGTWAVQVRMTPKNGVQSVGTCTFVSGNQASSLWQCSMSVATGTAALIARAYKL